MASLTATGRIKTSAIGQDVLITKNEVRPSRFRPGLCTALMIVTIGDAIKYGTVVPQYPVRSLYLEDGPSTL